MFWGHRPDQARGLARASWGCNANRHQNMAQCTVSAPHLGPPHRSVSRQTHSPPCPSCYLKRGGAWVGSGRCVGGQRGGVGAAAGATGWWAVAEHKHKHIVPAPVTSICSPIRYCPSSLMQRPCSSGGRSPAAEVPLPPLPSPPPSAARGLAALRRSRCALAGNLDACCCGCAPDCMQGRAANILRAALRVAQRVGAASNKHKRDLTKNAWMLPLADERQSHRPAPPIGLAHHTPPGTARGVAHLLACPIFLNTALPTQFTDAGDR